MKNKINKITRNFLYNEKTETEKNRNLIYNNNVGIFLKTTVEIHIILMVLIGPAGLKPPAGARNRGKQNYMYYT